MNDARYNRDDEVIWVQGPKVEHRGTVTQSFRRAGEWFYYLQVAERVAVVREAYLRDVTRWDDFRSWSRALIGCGIWDRCFGWGGVAKGIRMILEQMWLCVRDEDSWMRACCDANDREMTFRRRRGRKRTQR